MAEIKTLNELMQATAAHLVRRPVTVRDRKPAYKSRDGTAYQKGNQGYIDVNPDLTGAERLYVFAHECAHLAQSWGDPDLTPIHLDYPPGSIDARQFDAIKSRLPKFVAWEYRADKLAYKWLDWAEANYRNYGDDSWTLWVRKLWALLDYPGG